MLLLAPGPGLGLLQPLPAPSHSPPFPPPPCCPGPGLCTFGSFVKGELSEESLVYASGSRGTQGPAAETCPRGIKALVAGQTSHCSAWLK